MLIRNLLLVLIISFSYSQVANFSLSKDTICVGDTLILTNLSTGADSFIVDFNEEPLEDLDVLNSPKKGIMLLPQANPVGVRIARNSDGDYYAVAMIQTGDIYLFNLGKNPLDNNIVSQTNLGPVLPGLKHPINIQYVNGDYLIVVGSDTKEAAVLNFGNSLANTPTLINYSNLGGAIPGPVRGVNVVYNNGKYYLLTSMPGIPDLYIFELGPSLNVSTPAKIITIPLGTTFASGMAISIRKDTIEAFITRYNNRIIHRVTFIDSISSNKYTLKILTGTTGATACFNLFNIINRNLKTVYNIILNPNIYLVYKYDSTNNTYINKNVCNNCNIGHSSSVCKYNGQYYLLFASDSLYYKVFPETNNEGDTIFNSSTSQIKHVYKKTGKYYIQLLACTDTSGCTYKIDSIYVIPKADVSIITENACKGNNALITLKQNDTLNITNVIWDLGDGTIVNNQDTVSHIYNITGKVYINATVSDENGCVSNVKDSIIVYTPPTADFSFQLPQCLKDTVIFNNLSSTIQGDSIIFNKWLFGDGNYSNLPNPKHVYQQGGNYNVSLVVYSDKLCSDTIIKQVAAPGINIITDSACVNEPLTISFNAFYPNDNVNNFLWTINNNNYTQNPLTLTFNNTGNYTIKLKVSTNSGCNDSLQKEITITNKPPIQFNFGEERCINSPVEFKYTAIPSDFPVNNIVWDFDFNSTFDDKNGKNVYHTFYNTGKFPVKITVYNIHGCKNDSIFQVNVTNKPTANFIIKDTLCSNKNYLLKNTSQSQDSLTFLWMWNTGLISNKKEPLWTPDTGKYNITLIASTSSGCKDTISKNIIVNPSPKAIFLLFPENEEHIPFYLLGKNLSDTTNTTFFWNINSKFITDSLHLFHLIDSVDTYKVELIAKNNYSCYDTATKIINALPPIPEKLDIAILRAELFEDSIGNKYINTILQNQGNKNIYFWTFKIYFENSPAIYVNIFDSIQIGKTKSINVPISLEPTKLNTTKYVCIETIKPNNKTDINPNNNKKCIILSNNSELIRAYPNPFSDNITLEIISQQDSKVSIELYDILGRILYQVSYNIKKGKNDLLIPLPELSNGNYILKVSTPEFNTNIKISKKK